jgi:hypothetical protein
MKRIPYKPSLWIDPVDSLVLKRSKSAKERTIKGGNWFIDRNTPVGDDAILYERKPYGGKREVALREVVAIIRPDISTKKIKKSQKV